MPTGHWVFLCGFIQYKRFFLSISDKLIISYHGLSQFITTNYLARMVASRLFKD